VKNKQDIPIVTETRRNHRLQQQKVSTMSRATHNFTRLAVLPLLAILWQATRADETDKALRDQASATLRKAAEYYRNKVALHGGYVYYYSPDLKLRHGEGPATATQIWVQPPGTPTVGLAYLAAYRATNEKFYLDAAREAGEALMYGQLKSGGWQNCIDFDPKGRVNLYRNGKGGGQNNSTLDDNISQSAIQFMSKLDEALEFKDRAVHESAMIALDALLKAQFANGAFPQVWTGPVREGEAPAEPAKKANYPNHDYRTEGKVKDYWNMYTLNDGLAGTVSETLLVAANVYKDTRFRTALAKLGDFLVLAQMPEPQPVWAQQYNRDMQPIWARRFEPAAITGGESQDAIETLMKIYRSTADKKYLEPIPRALAYLKKSLLPDGRLARYYEMKTNRPLYMNRTNGEYFLTFDDADLPDHYGWKVYSRLDAIEAEYNSLASTSRSLQKDPPADELQQEAKKIIAAFDAEGRWISTYSGEGLYGQPKFKSGDRYINSAVFSKNLETLSNFLTAK
jgi:PelA/Pel-15E family pectate lyase